MISIISIDHHIQWDSFVNEIPSRDVYYLSGYVRAFQAHGDGKPVLICFSDGDYRAACVMMVRDVAQSCPFMDLHLPANRYYDLITPYGYGGFCFNKEEVPAEVCHKAMKELTDFLKEKGFVSAFFRFHPVLSNSSFHSCSDMDIVNLGKTITIDLESEDTIWGNISSKNRNMIRKSQKSGVVIKMGKGIQLLRKFKEIYNETMDQDNADPYYYFEDSFYQSIDSYLNDNYQIFYAEYDGIIIAMAIMIFAGDKLNYHLSGSKFEYRHYAPGNLLLYKAALWGALRGFKTLHLGGGVGSGEDSLYKFKAAFNRNSDSQFSIGKMVIDEVKYNELLSLRSISEGELANISFFPAYRVRL